ncbi:MAG: Na+/H+ antiporter NhaA [Gammaproteobacteria bacterium]|nr:Na+/H+ antiporter NhaA [Gammaproteobacteria bacterium]
MTNHPDPGSPFGQAVRKFVHLESAGGIVLMIAVVAAMLLKNSPAAGWYTGFLNINGAVILGPLELQKPLFIWVNDAWMAIFFFLIGMELKRELLYGYLSDRSQLVLPAAAALGGMVVPAMIYLYFNGGDAAAAHGWAIPTATDIAFALGVLSLLASRVPVSLKIFLMTVAVIDDLGAIIVIALFYTSKLSLLALCLSLLGISALFIVNRSGVRTLAPYLIIGTLLWLCVLKSGVHATLAGVILGLSIPGRATQNATDSPLESTIRDLHPWVAFAILPMFAFVNAGIAFEGMNISRMLEPIPSGIFLGLVIGKPLGVLLLSLLVVAFGLAKLPPGMNWTRLTGVSILCGIGFTMSIFIGSLALQEAAIGYARIDRLAIILASLLSSILGYLVLRFARAQNA